MSKLGKLYEERNQLLDEFNALQTQKKAVAARIQKVSRRLKSVGQAIYDLKQGGDGKTPHITDHAIVRYLERVEKVDIQELKVKVAQHLDAVRDGNVIVTVNDPQFYEEDV